MAGSSLCGTIPMGIGYLVLHLRPCDLSYPVTYQACGECDEGVVSVTGVLKYLEPKRISR